MASSTAIPVLPAAAALTFLAEGGANVVYRVHLPPDAERGSGDDQFGPGTPPPSELEEWQVDNDIEWHGTVLRLRKDVPHARSVVESERLFEQHIRPLFSEQHVIRQTRVIVPENVLARLNEKMRQMEANGSRPKARQGQYLRTEGYGLVLRDMHYWPPGTHGTTLELKPKWLLASPDAPPNSKRCRTCALSAMRGTTTLKFCPLGLGWGTEAEVERVLKSLKGVEGVSDAVWAEVVKDVAVAARHGVIAQLRDAQQRLDTTGVRGTDHATHELMTAMTIRDCTLYIRIPADLQTSCELLLGDLDLKSPGKFAYWVEVEEKLIKGGWYTVESTDSGVRCFLERVGGS